MTSIMNFFIMWFKYNGLAFGAGGADFGVGFAQALHPLFAGFGPGL
jgi:hypothetical protein